MSKPPDDNRWTPGVVLLLWLISFLLAATFAAQLTHLWSK